jgi:calcineurin-like phosphoesterase family protein
MIRILVTADLHLGHTGLSDDNLRPKNFSEKILTNLNRMVNPGDVLICLGDVCLGNDAEWHERLAVLFPPDYCKRWLVRGNHDRKSNTFYLEHGWSMVCDSFSLEAFGKKILFSHMPQKDNGWFDLNIHGHFHDFGMERVKETEPHLHAIVNEKHKLISLEALHYEPIKLQRIVEGILIC